MTAFLPEVSIFGRDLGQRIGHRMVCNAILPPEVKRFFGDLGQKTEKI